MAVFASAMVPRGGCKIGKLAMLDLKLLNESQLQVGWELSYQVTLGHPEVVVR
jgi:hypothetical protein